MAADNYTTIALLSAAIGAPLARIADANNSATLTGNTQLQAAVDAANAVVEDYIRGRYPLPLASIPASIRRHAENIAIYFWKSAVKRADLTEGDLTNYKEAIKYLTDCSKGVVTLQFPAPDRRGIAIVPTAITVGENVTTQGVSGASGEDWFNN